MLKSRRFWVVLSGFAILLVTPPAIYRLWWHPYTPRGRFERVRLGMTEPETKQIMGKPDPKHSTRPYGMVDQEVWWFERGIVKYNRSQFFNEVVNDLKPYSWHWAHNKTIFKIRFDQHGNADKKCVQSPHRSSPIWDQLKTWLPLP